MIQHTPNPAPMEDQVMATVLQDLECVVSSTQAPVLPRSRQTPPTSGIPVIQAHTPQARPGLASSRSPRSLQKFASFVLTLRQCRALLPQRLAPAPTVSPH